MWMELAEGPEPELELEQMQMQQDVTCSLCLTLQPDVLYDPEASDPAICTDCFEAQLDLAETARVGLNLLFPGARFESSVAARTNHAFHSYLATCSLCLTDPDHQESPFAVNFQIARASSLQTLLQAGGLKKLNQSFERHRRGSHAMEAVE